MKISPAMISKIPRGSGLCPDPWFFGFKTGLESANCNENEENKKCEVK